MGRIVAIIAALVVVPSAVCAQRGPASDPPGKERGSTALEQAADWKMDVLRLKNGRERQGLVRAKRDDEIDFIEVNRPAGKPMNLVVMSLDPKSVAGIDWASPEDRKLLLERIGPLLSRKSHVRIEAGRMEDVPLKEIVRDGVRYYICRTAWFTLESTADEDSTRRCVVRIEQVFRAFRRLLPPRAANRGELRVQLFGSMDEYRRHLAAQGLVIENPAYYSSTRNTIAAGSDLVRYAERLAEVRGQNEALRKQYEQRNREVNRRLAELAAQMRKADISKADIEYEQRIRKANWDREFKEMFVELARIDRQNAELFESVASQMFHRLYHEAFHAYVENYAYPSAQFRVPRWLNEGLAQIFENGQIDAEDTLRIDAPNKTTLTDLQVDLAQNRLSLAELLAADENSFLYVHGDPLASERNYRYSWGLAWYLTFEEDLLGGERLAAYLARNNPEPSPQARFETLVGTPLPRFEADWRKAMFNLRAPP